MSFKPTIDKSKCTGCGKCISLCPLSAIYISNDKAHIDENICRNCHLCLRICPNSAIKLSNQ